MSNSNDNKLDNENELLKNNVGTETVEASKLNSNILKQNKKIQAGAPSIDLPLSNETTTQTVVSQSPRDIIYNDPKTIFIRKTFDNRYVLDTNVAIVTRHRDNYYTIDDEKGLRKVKIDNEMSFFRESPSKLKLNTPPIKTKLNKEKKDDINSQRFISSQQGMYIIPQNGYLNSFSYPPYDYNYMNYPSQYTMLPYSYQTPIPPIGSTAYTPDGKIVYLNTATNSRSTSPSKNITAPLYYYPQSSFIYPQYYQQQVLDNVDTSIKKKSKKNSKNKNVSISDEPPKVLPYDMTSGLTHVESVPLIIGPNNQQILQPIILNEETNNKGSKQTKFKDLIDKNVDKLSDKSRNESILSNNVETTQK